jgi:hypothetical protein
MVWLKILSMESDHDNKNGERSFLLTICVNKF